MSEIIVDTSVFVAVVLRETEKEELVRVTAGAKLLVAPTVGWEVGNALAAMMKRGRLSISEVQEAYKLFRLIETHAVKVRMLRALELAFLLNIYAYDAYVLDICESTGHPLLTLDRRLITQAKARKLSALNLDR